MTKPKFIADFIKKEPVLSVSFLLSVLSLCIFRPAPDLIFKAIDWRTIGILFSLMITVKAFQSKNLLDAAAAGLLKLCKSKRSLYLFLTLFVFFISMLVTNDVALLTFVPLTILLCSKANVASMTLVILETLAANLGSCITPMGNPQNLFLYSFYNFSPVEFFSLTLLIGVPSLLLLVLIILIITRNNESFSSLMTSNGNAENGSEAEGMNTSIDCDWKFVLYCLNFILCLLTVFRIVPFYISLAVTVVVMAVCNFRLFARVDYSLLLTFVFLFIFTGTLSSVEKFSAFLNEALTSPVKTYGAGLICSQFISNVPAALLLSGFTGNGKELLLSVNVGGLGTLIASMASVISFKLYRNSEEGEKCGGKYFAAFSAWNFSLLIILALLVWFAEKLLILQ